MSGAVLRSLGRSTFERPRRVGRPKPRPTAPLALRAASHTTVASPLRARVSPVHADGSPLHAGGMHECCQFPGGVALHPWIGPPTLPFPCFPLHPGRGERRTHPIHGPSILSRSPPISAAPAFASHSCPTPPTQRKPSKQTTTFHPCGCPFRAKPSARNSVSCPSQRMRRPAQRVRRPAERMRRPAERVRRPAHSPRRPSHPTRRAAERPRRPVHPVRRPSQPMRRPAHPPRRPTQRPGRLPV